MRLNGRSNSTQGCTTLSRNITSWFCDRVALPGDHKTTRRKGAQKRTTSRIYPLLLFFAYLLFLSQFSFFPLYFSLCFLNTRSDSPFSLLLLLSVRVVKYDALLRLFVLSLYNLINIIFFLAFRENKSWHMHRKVVITLHTNIGDSFLDVQSK